MNESCENCPIGEYIVNRDKRISQLKHANQLCNNQLSVLTRKDRWNGTKSRVERTIEFNTRNIEILQEYPVSSEEVLNCTGPFERDDSDSSFERICGAVIMKNLSEDIEVITALSTHEV
jgi:hypothetical protein